MDPSQGVCYASHMALEVSPYEGMLDNLGGKIALGQIISVDATSRTVRVKGLGNKSHGTDDQDLQNVKLLHLAWHPEGDFGVAIPRVGSYCIVGYLNSEPFVIGAYPLSNTFGGGGRDNQEDLLPGDFAYMSVAGNRVVVRSGGTVEIESTKGCRTYWLPTEDTISTVCQNFELDTAGGFFHWNVDQASGDSLLQVKAYPNREPTNAVDLQVGATESGAILDLAIGPVDDELALTSKTLNLTVQSDGSTVLDIGPGKVTIALAADGKLTMTMAGDTTIKANGNVDIDASGDVNVTAGGNAKVQASQIQLNGSASGVTTANSHQGVIDMITGIPVQPSTTVFADV